MSIPQRPRGPRVSAADFAKRFEAEKKLQQRRYCDAFELWRQCPHRQCRREKSCRGDQNACLKRALEIVPHRTQWQARQDILVASPPNLGAPERAARQCMPGEFYAQSTAHHVAQYLMVYQPERSRASARNGRRS